MVIYDKYVRIYDANGEFVQYDIKDTYEYSGFKRIAEWEYDENWNKTKYTETIYDAKNKKLKYNIIDYINDKRTYYDSEGNVITVEDYGNI